MGIEDLRSTCCGATVREEGIIIRYFMCNACDFYCNTTEQPPASSQTPDLTVETK